MEKMLGSVLCSITLAFVLCDSIPRLGEPGLLYKRPSVFDRVSNGENRGTYHNSKTLLTLFLSDI